MSKKTFWILILTLGICSGILWAAQTPATLQDTLRVTHIFEPKDSLKGLQGVAVAVEELRPDIERYGLTSQQIKNDVELRLRQKNIKVLSKQEWLMAPGEPFLYVNINVVVKDNGSIASYNLSVQLIQHVFLSRDLTKAFFATTWQNLFVGSVDVNKIESIRQDVEHQVDAFINDYLAVNPKE